MHGQPTGVWSRAPQAVAGTCKPAWARASSGSCRGGGQSVGCEGLPWCPPLPSCHLTGMKLLFHDSLGCFWKHSWLQRATPHPLQPVSAQPTPWTSSRSVFPASLSSYPDPAVCGNVSQLFSQPERKPSRDGPRGSTVAGVWAGPQLVAAWRQVPAGLCSLPWCYRGPRSCIPSLPDPHGPSMSTPSPGHIHETSWGKSGSTTEMKGPGGSPEGSGETVLGGRVSTEVGPFSP